jgi:transposase-like protein/transposase
MPAGIRRELPEAVPMAGKRKSHSAAFKAQVGLAAAKGDLAVNELASRYGVHRTLIHAWKRQILAGAEAVFASGAKATRLESLLLENRDLRERERQCLLFMGRFALGHIPAKEMKRLLADRLPPNDFDTLFSHANSPSRPRRLRAQIIFFHLCGMPKRLIAEFLGVYFRTVKKYILRYTRKGVASLFVPRAGVRKYDDLRFKEIIFTILHSPPKEHGFNRASWRRRDIHTAAARLGMPIGKNYIDRIIRDAGYRFRKARVVLTSNDPSYREKVDHIIKILSRLKPTERFFSIDEFGPFAVKQQGGRRLVGPGENPTVPQFQVSKGSLIATAALELSTNQVTHFYSTGKNTVEMIKLLDLLLEQYRGCSKLYLSWDAASWHASKRFLARVAEVNARKYRRENGTPAIDLAPLPSRAQFLNVIESVFSGMAKAVIDNSDYASPDEAKAAIDRHFAMRNAHFRANPRRAGGKIWGKERVPNTFREGQNCKDPRYR